MPLNFIVNEAEKYFPPQFKNKKFAFKIRNS